MTGTSSQSSPRSREEAIADIRALIRDHPQAHRCRLSQLLCQRWGWRNSRGQLKDMAARNLMLKLHEQGAITLPPPLRPATNGARGTQFQRIALSGRLFEGDLPSISPIELELIEPDHPRRELFGSLLAQHHYLGYRGAAGENVQYLAKTAAGLPVACLVFEAAAWKVAARDRYLKRDGRSAQSHLESITNNSRFLILPKIPTYCYTSSVLSCQSNSVCGSCSGIDDPAWTFATAA